MLQSTTMRVLLIVVLVAAAGGVLFTCTGPTTELTVPTNAAAKPTEDPTATADTAPAVATTTKPAAAGRAGESNGAITFALDPSASEARFLINEVLLGIPTEVKGVTSQITGTVTIDPASPAQSRVGTITVNARDLRTDRDLRNRAIRRFILESGRDEYQYITFMPRAVQGLPAQTAPGDSFTIQVTGDLTIKNVTKRINFAVEVTADSTTEISGLAKATIKRSDFNLSIPSAPGVADVSDEVQLELSFQAKAEAS